MITYFDTSVVVPLIVEEPASADCRDIWVSSDRRISTRLLFVEASAAVERLAREGRISQSEKPRALRMLGELWRGVEVVELDQNLMVESSVLAGRFGLRGYDAVHCAAAAEISDRDCVAASADGKLVEAWTALGLNVFRPG